MAWINDVVPYTTILSTWGNNVRDQLIHKFASAAERDTHNANLADGSITYQADTQSLTTKRGGAWYPLVSRTIVGTTYDIYTQGASLEVKIADIVLPAGYRAATLVYSGRSLSNTYSSDAFPMLDIRLLSPAAAQLFRTQENFVGNIADYRMHHHVSVTVANPAAGTYQWNMSCSNSLNSRRVVNDGSQQCYAILVP